MKKNYSMRVMLLLLLFVTSIAWAQERIVKGKVTSTEDGSPVPGVNVVIKGTTNGTTTDADGVYSLSVPADGGILVFSFIGLKTEEIAVNARTVVDIGLGLDVTQLSEIVVTGYGTQRRDDIIGNTAQVKGGAIASIPVQSFDAALGGRAAGVQVSIPNGVLNNPPVFRIRGTNSINLSSYPLIVIDGVPTFTGDQSSTLSASNPLSSINPSDIESMEILKDAAATAIYGSRAANGVVLITTKKGKKGKAKVNYDGWVGVTSPYRQWDMLNAEQYMTIKNEGLANVGAAPRYLPAEGPDGNTIDTDWSDVLFRTGVSSSHSLNVQGGTDATSYFFSTGYTKQEGIIVGNDFDRMSVRFNVDHKLNDWFSLGISTNYANELNHSIVNSGSIDGNSYASSGIGRLALSLPPNVSPYKNDGTYNLNGNQIGSMGNTENITFQNPQPMIDNNYSDTENDRVQGNVYLQISPLKGLNVRTVYGIDYLNATNRNFYTALQGDGFSSAGSTFSTLRKLKRSVWTTTAQYDKVIAEKHNLNVLIGTEQQTSTNEGFGLSRIGVSDPFFNVIQGGWTTNNTSGLEIGENYLWSGFGRLDYNFNKKYYFGTSFRRDGYSAFAKDFKYGNFYSFSAAWDIAKESFWESLSGKVNSFRLRGSYGTVGNQSGIDNYAASSFYNSGYYNGGATLFFTQAGNNGLFWETSKKLDVGVTFGLFNDRISGEVAWYKNNIDGMLLNVPQAPSTGMPNNPLANVGSMFNQGIEITLNATPINKGEFTWNTSINFSTNKNEITQLAPGTDFITSATSGLETASITQPGYAIGTLWVVKSDGVNPENGRRIFVTKSGERVQYDHSAAPGTRYTKLDGTAYPAGIVSGVDNVPYANTNPKYYGGFDNTVRYKNFDLNVLFTYMGGFSVYNGTRATVLDQRFWNSTTAVLDRWQNPGDVTDIPRLVYADNTSNGSAFPISANVEKGDFVKLRNVMLGYKLPSSAISKIGLASVRVYASGQNLFVITGYTGPDPEVSSNGNANLRQGIDRNTVPNGRTFTLGVNLGF